MIEILCRLRIIICSDTRIKCVLQRPATLHTNHIAALQLCIILTNPKPALFACSLVRVAKNDLITHPTLQWDDIPFFVAMPTRTNANCSLDLSFTNRFQKVFARTKEHVAIYLSKCDRSLIQSQQSIMSSPVWHLTHRTQAGAPDILPRCLLFVVVIKQHEARIYDELRF